MFIFFFLSVFISCYFILHDTYYRHIVFFFFFKQKTAYEMRISDWSSDVCSSDLDARAAGDVAVLADLRAGADGGPGVDHRARADVRADVEERRHQHHVLADEAAAARDHARHHAHTELAERGLVEDRKSVVSGKGVSVRVDLGGRRTLKKNK